MRPYYQDSAVSIYLGDCRDVLSTLAPELRVGATITDPPYEAEAHTLGRRQVDPRKQVVTACPLSFDPMSETERDLVSLLIARVTERWALVFCQVEAAMLWRAALSTPEARIFERPPLRYMRTMIWTKPNGQPQLSGDRPGMGYESIVAMHTEGKSRWNGGGRLGVFTYPIDANFSREPRLHETQKPLALMKELVGLFSEPGEVVLDPYAGSGTTLRAAKDLGRRAIGIEIEERHAETAARRMAQEVLAL